MRRRVGLQREITRRTNALRLMAERKLGAFYSLVGGEAVEQPESTGRFEVRLAATP